MRRPALVAVLAAAALIAVAPAGAARVIHDWPCAGCIVQVPSKPGTKRLPLLVALHGDEGDPSLTASIWGPVADALHVVLLAPHCPGSDSV